MTVYPEYQDSLANEHLGKSRLPILVVLSKHQHSYPLHYHSFAELSLVMEGTGTEIVNGNPHRFRKGTVTFLLPHHMHEVRLSSTRAFKYNCMFDLNLLFLSPSERELVNALLKTGVDYPSHYDLNEEQCAYMAGLLESMRLEYENEGFGKDSILRSMLIEAFVFLLRIPANAPPHVKSSARQGEALKGSLAEQIQSHLHVHYQEEITLHGIADQFGVNASYLSRMFKQSTGKTFTEYLQALRIDRAASLLAITSMSITEIAVDVGFEQTRALTRVFKAMKGIAPKQYRTMMAGEVAPQSGA
ncbi:MAG: transcriptional regulator, AraC family [Paenibacillus sp.]|nr:transcriptional regulator, AraC family [Paenibacillus sp.]